ncbi:hypothetical protein OG555_04860 [Kribbella sp. NBC_01484]|uniref:hypothetical protein n=1 Tax=Kribbella sp. NBC_01484 TaxID=2903579 RepID=UPI002E308008|nr:hypothetical protein [Kribbella sp. NBC_01484]
MANSRIGEGVTPGQLTRFFDENTVSTQAWDLVRHRVVTEYAFKIGDVPGIVVFMEVDSADEGSEIVNGLPVVQQGLLTFELDPIGKTMRF